MSGLNIGGRAFVVPSVVPLVGSYLGEQAVYTLSITPGQDPTQRTTATANIVAAPIVSPDKTKILFSDTGNLMEVTVGGGPGDEVLIWDGATGPTGFAYSPDGNTILFTVSDASTRHRLYTIPADGTNQSGNESILYSDASSRQICGASYNSSGTKISFHILLSSTSLGVWTCNSDGSGATQIGTTATTLSQIQFEQPILGWMRSSSRLAWNDGTLASPVWKTMLDDGTSIVTLASLANGDGRPTWNSWFMDDSFIVRRKSSDGSIYKVAASGAGDSLLITPSVAAVGEVRVFDGRVYWDSGADIWSCLEDGTDERNETGASAASFSLLG